jgi:Ala-tRNA(Pro) deacylase
MAAAVHEKGAFVAKVFIAWADGELAMFVLPAYSRVDLSRAKELLGCEMVRRALEAEFSRVFPDCEVGAMPPFGNLYDLPVYLERTLASQPYLVFSAGTHTDTVRMAMADYVRLAAPIVADFVIHGPERAAAT